MERAVVVRGRLSDPRHIELEEPVTEILGAVEVVVRSDPRSRPEPDEAAQTIETGGGNPVEGCSTVKGGDFVRRDRVNVIAGSDVFDVIAALAGGSRSKAHIDGQIQEERDAWDRR